MAEGRDQVGIGRREFLRRGTTAVGAGALARFSGVSLGALACSTGSSRRLGAIGLQLYTVRSEMEKSVDATLARVANVGYTEVEFAGYFGKSPAEIRALLDNTGLQAPSAHVDLADIRTKWGPTLEGASEIGHRYLVCPSIDEKDRDADGYKRVAQEFNEAAREAKRHDILFAYHNHDFDFAPLGDTVGYDILLAETDPSLVLLEADLYWMNKAKRDPLAYFAKYPGRFPLVHVKDMAPDGAMSDVGSGTLPFARYFAKSAEAGIRHYFVERDDASDAFASITRSYTYLKTLGF